MSDRLFVATRKGLFTVSRGGQDGGAGWHITRVHFLGDNVPMVLPASQGNTVYAALAHGHFGAKFQRSEDGGETWVECQVPEYPEPPEGREPDVCPMSGKPIPWKLELIWSLETGGADEPGVLWCGTIPGGLFRSTDRGNSWSMVRSLWDEPGRKNWFGGGYDYPGIHSILVDPRDPRRVTVGISCGGVWVSGDGGETWACKSQGMRAAYLPPDRAYDPEAQDPHRLARCGRQPDTFWAQHHNGIFRSTDACESWHEIEHVPVSSFGFATIVHPSDADTAWFVPGVSDEKRIAPDGRLVVTRTRDGGRSFEELREGLPQSHAYDITFRHAMDIDDTGEVVVFGTSTGSLWISENQGDSWACVANHLPPVYCTRFVK